MGIKSRLSELPKSTKNLLIIGVLLAFVVALPLFIWGISTQKFLISQKASSGEPIACTQDAMVCPDGSYVGRVAPNCDFAQCPTVVPNSCGGTCGTNLNCQPGLICYTGFCRNPACTSDLACGCGSPTKSFWILFKFDGVSDGSAEGAGVRILFNSPTALPGGVSLGTSPIHALYIGNGVYRLEFGVPSSYLKPAGDYSIVLKGEKHIGIKFCSASGQTTRCVTNGSISLIETANTQSFNFSGIPLPAGDTYTQDGRVDAIDFARISVLLSKSYTNQTEQDLMVGDLDYNGRVDIRDMLLLRDTLETRYDEY